jgi:Zn-dependent M28 family amino/carboxypeptidase
MRRVAVLCALLAPLALPSRVTAQMATAAKTPANAAVERGAATITEADVARRIHIIADDSMLGRDTPSRGLELTARYVASVFQQNGLKPAGDSGGYLQWYPIEQSRFNPAGSHVGFMVGSTHTHASFTSDARWRYGDVPAGEISGPVLLVGGRLDSTAVDPSRAAGRVVVLVVDYSGPVAAGTNAALQALIQSDARAIVLASNRDSAQFAQALASDNQPRIRLAMRDNMSGGAGVPVVEVQDRATSAALAKAGVNLADVRRSRAAVVRSLDSLTIMIDGHETQDQSLRAPNTVGILEGTDPVLKHEYVVFSAHMDHVGVNTPQKGSTDSIWNGADDDGSGTTGIMELAEAFAQPGARPRRSLIFLTVSGEEKGLWGSRWFSEHPVVPMKQIVADLNMDMIGRNWKDTIVVIGKEHSDLGTTLNRVNAAHPELGMTAIDDIWPEERFYFRSDHYNFARKGVPILFFFNGTHEDYHGPGDEPDKIEAEKESRIIKLVYYLGQDVANADARPKWKPESYKEIVEQ